jgi:methyl-accepting chemotaxis protein
MIERNRTRQTHWAYARLMQALAPGERLMSHLRLHSKLALLGVLVVAPLLLLGALSMQDLWRALQAGQRQSAGLQALEQLVRVVPELQLQRAQLMDEASAPAPAQANSLATSRRNVDEAMLALERAMTNGPLAPALDSWHPLQERLQASIRGTETGFAAQSALLDSLLRQIRRVAEVSGLLFNGDAVTFEMIDLLVNVDPPLSEALAKTLALGGAAHAAPSRNPAELAEVLSEGQLAARLQLVLSDRLEAVARHGGEAPGSAEPARVAVEQFMRDVEARLGTTDRSGDADRFRERGTHALALVHALQRDLILRLQDRISDKERLLWLELTTRATGIFAVLIAIGYLMSALVVSMRRSLNHLHRGTAAIAAGNLTHPLRVAGRDELADIGRIVEAMSARLSTMVAEIRNSASFVNLTGQEVSVGSTRLAGRTDEQAGSLRSSIAAISSLSVDMARNAEAALELDRLAQSLTGQAEKGHLAMQETVTSMRQLQQAVEQVSEMVRVIDEVAFQTSMLSLNAAIEASRAGESGRGFAVVATEVGQLAQRCAESAEEIRVLIGNTGAQAQLSTEKLDAASSSLDGVVRGVRDISGALRIISDHSTQHSQDLQQVTHAVGSLDEITRENAKLVEQSATASHALVTRADRLRDAVSSMRLRQGSADEALGLVERAVAHVKAAGLERAVADFHDPGGAFIDRDLYVFALGRDGRYVACGAKPANVGQLYSVTKGQDEVFLRSAWAAAEAGGDWVQCTAIDPITQLVRPKESWIVQLDEETLLGCGVHRDATAEPVIQPLAAGADRSEHHDNQPAPAPA